MNEVALDVRKYFAEFGIRLAAVVLDLFIVLALLAQVVLPAVPSITGTPLDTMPAVLAIVAIYFVLCWASPLKATPIQFVFGMRVVDLAGNRLPPGRALMRAAALTVPTSERYPDGGYFELEEDGVIRIRFEVMRQLKSGSLVFRPETRDKEVAWNCSVDGYIARKYLPRICRN